MNERAKKHVHAHAYARAHARTWCPCLCPCLCSCICLPMCVLASCSAFLVPSFPLPLLFSSVVCAFLFSFFRSRPRVAVCSSVRPLGLCSPGSGRRPRLPFFSLFFSVAPRPSLFCRPFPSFLPLQSCAHAGRGKRGRFLFVPASSLAHSPLHAPHLAWLTSRLPSAPIPSLCPHLPPVSPPLSPERFLLIRQ